MILYPFYFREAQDTLKLRESKLLKEKDDLRKIVKQQEQILHKITNDKNDLETKYKLDIGVIWSDVT